MDSEADRKTSYLTGLVLTIWMNKYLYLFQPSLNIRKII